MYKDKDLAAFCHCCGQKIMDPDPHRMDRSKVQLLRVLDEAGGWVKCRAGSRVIDHGAKTGAPYLAQDHANRLVYFGLAEYGPSKSSTYRINQAGRDFLNGKIGVPSVIWVKGGKVLERSTVFVYIKDIKGI